MKDYDSSEEISKRISQEDPLIMYLIVRKELDMSIGKTAAQCAHASQMLQLKHNQFKDSINQYILPPFSKEVFELFNEWLDSSFRKVVLKASDKEWVKVKSKIIEKHRVVVIDAGLTEIDSGTETVIGIVPMRKSEVPKIISKLRLL